MIVIGDRVRIVKLPNGVPWDPHSRLEGRLGTVVGEMMAGGVVRLVAVRADKRRGDPVPLCSSDVSRTWWYDPKKLVAGFNRPGRRPLDKPAGS